MAITYQFYIIPICSILTFLSSIACIASKLIASQSFNEATQGGAVTAFAILDAEFPGQNIKIANYPAYLRLNARTIVVVASSIALLISIAVAALSVRAMLKRKPVFMLWYQRQGLLFVLFINASLALAAFITNFVLHSKSAHFSLFYRSMNGGFGYGDSYDAGVFDLETWTCEVQSLPFRHKSPIIQQCAAETASRALTVTVFIFSLGLFLAVWWDAEKHRALTVVEWDGDRMAWDDEDDCELDDVAATRQLGHTSLPSKHA